MYPEFPIRGGSMYPDFLIRRNHKPLVFALLQMLQQRWADIVPLPFTPMFDETSFHWIIQDIVHNISEFIPSPHNMIISLMLPKLSCPLKHLVASICGEYFMTL